MSSSPTSVSRRSNEERAKRIEQYYIRHDKDKKRTYLHFMDEGLNKKTIYHILRRHDQRGDVTFKRPTGRRVSVCTPEMFDKIANLFKENPELSCREAAKKLGIARTTIFRIMAKMREKNLETYKIIDSEPRCPTCHQKIDSKKLDSLTNSSNNSVAINSSSSNNNSSRNKKQATTRKLAANKNKKERDNQQQPNPVEDVDNYIHEHPTNNSIHSEFKIGEANEFII